jgi:uncharacterized protein
MFKLLLIVAAVVAVVWLLRRAIAGPRRDEARPGAPSGELVACAQCGVNLPKAEARGEDGRFYCSEEHWRLGPRDG